MDFVVRGLNIEVSPMIRSYAERRLVFALGRFADHIRRVRVLFMDINGHRGGVDKRCRVEVHMRSQRAIRFEAVEEDLLAAIDRVADGLGRVMARELSRGRRAVRLSNERVLLHLAQAARNSGEVEAEVG